VPAAGRAGLTATATVAADREAGRPRIRWTQAWPIVLRPTGNARVHLVQGAGGPLGGDVLALDVRVGTGAALGAIVAVLGYGLVHLLRPAALGLGDVKLAAPLGTVLGGASWSALAIGAVLAAVITGCVALLRLCVSRAPPHAAVPHGPSMLAAAWLLTLATAAGGG